MLKKQFKPFKPKYTKKKHKDANAPFVKECGQCGEGFTTRGKICEKCFKKNGRKLEK